MRIDQPRFPTPEDERRAYLLYQALRELANIDEAKAASSMKTPGDTGRAPQH